MSPRQVVVWRVEPRFHDVFASRSVRYTCEVEPTVTKTGACARRKSGDAASPVTVRSVSPSGPQRAPFGKFRSSLLRAIDVKPEPRSPRLRTTERAVACPAFVSAFFGCPSPASADAGATSAAVRAARSSRRTISLYSAGVSRHDSAHRGSYARFGRNQRSTVARSIPLRPA